MALNELSELEISKGFSDVDELLSSDKYSYYTLLITYYHDESHL